MANRHKAQAFAKGGKVLASPAHESKIEREAGLKRGGVAKLKTGGKVQGRASGGRLDKRARGGGVGKSPFSKAHFGK